MDFEYFVATAKKSWYTIFVKKRNDFVCVVLVERVGFPTLSFVKGFFVVNAKAGETLADKIADKIAGKALPLIQ